MLRLKCFPLFRTSKNRYMDSSRSVRDSYANVSCDLGCEQVCAVCWWTAAALEPAGLETSELILAAWRGGRGSQHHHHRPSLLHCTGCC